MRGNEAFIEYYPCGEPKSERRKILPIELAGYLGTEWIPGAPRSFELSLTEILETVLTPKKLFGSCDFWCVNSDLANSNSQWKGVTSWIVGVAFTRYVMQEEGYIWWSPVSGFKGTGSTGSTTIGDWMSELPRSRFSVERIDTKSNLLPDYAACRMETGSKYQYAFVESKGNKRCLDNLHSAPSDWLNQVGSATLKFDDEIKPVANRYVVATRVNPNAKYDNTRRIVVRAWDPPDDVYGGDYIELAHFLRIHYSGLLHRIGFHGAAELLTQSTESFTDAGVSSERSEPSSNRRLLDFDVLTENGLDTDTSVKVITELNSQSSLRFSNITYTFGLVPQVRNLLQALVGYDPNSLPTAIDRLLSRTEELTEKFANSENVFVLRNGVVVHRSR